MKRFVIVALAAVAFLSPSLAFAGSSTNAALGLGAFAVFNQILSGTGIFGAFSQPVVAAPVVVVPPAPVVVAPPAPVIVVAPPAPVIVAPPQPVVFAPHPVVVGPWYGHYAPRPVRYYTPPPVHRPAPHLRPVARPWCPPGHAKHGRCD